MSKTKRLVLAGLFIGLPLATTACRIDVGNGCTALIFEPGVQFGVVCNPL
ncbi:MAG TPA: hypothetical protein VJM33_14635 [Microthrixaceae bacterium]|nr:hypothetical protein [Microthrixaceae bacterium]